MKIAQNSKQKQKFNSVLISGIVVSFITILVCIGMIIWFIWIISTSTELGKIGIELTWFFIIFFFFSMIGQIIILIFAVSFLKGKFDNKRTIAILNLFSGDIIPFGIINAILILIGTDQQNNTQDFSTQQMRQIDLEYQEFLRYKEHNKINR